MIAVDGAAAEAWASRARALARATGRRLKPGEGQEGPVADELPVHVTEVAAGVARPTPPCDDEDPGIHEVQPVSRHDRGARKYIYIENQYFTSEKIGRGAGDSAGRGADGPEIVVVTGS